jgi:hypothetical protein
MVEVQDIFQRCGGEYAQAHALSPQQHKALYAISQCRTEHLGGHMDACPSCGYVKPSYNSCRNRHCPKCQAFAKERWVENQRFNLLNVGYFHAVFTIPDLLNPILLQNQEKLYRLLFTASAATLKELATDKKYLGAAIGCTCVLHTWGQNLMFHPHIHCIVPGGGLSKCGKWVSSRKKFFIPVKVLSRKFRGKFLALLKAEQLQFHGQQAYLSDPLQFQTFLDACYAKEWIVYCKPPFKDASCVVTYLGRYTHRVAISNNRILSMGDGSVSFKWRDYKDSNKWKIMTIANEEFIRRFLLHVLPKGFMKIRHYGLLGNRNKTEKLLICKRLTHTAILPREKLPTLALLQKITGREIGLCPACRTSRLQFFSSLSPPLIA